MEEKKKGSSNAAITIAAIIIAVVIIGAIVIVIAAIPKTEEKPKNMYAASMPSEIETLPEETATETTAAKSDEAQPFSTQLQVNERTYADIISIIPKYVVGQPSDAYGIDINPKVKGIICECTTQQQEIIYIYMTTDQYKNLFDKDAVFAEKVYEWLSGEENIFELITYEVPLRVEGLVISANDLATDLQSTINSEVLMSIQRIAEQTQQEMADETQ